MMGYEPRALPSLISDSSIPAVESRLKSLVAARDEALAAHELARQVMSSRNNRGFTPFAKGDKVWLEARNLKRSIANPKFAPKREGPFTIVKVLSPITYQLRLPKTWKIHHTFHASLLTPYRENEVHGRNFPALPPDLIEGEEEYEIEKILRHRGSLSARMFLIRWKGYSAEEDSWIAERELKHAKSALEEYKKLHPSVFSPQSSPPTRKTTRRTS